MKRAQTQQEHRQLAGAQNRLETWRRRHGGPGRPIPEQFWDEAVALARVVGVGAAARALRLDQQRLARRTGGSEGSCRRDSEAPDGFVEVDTSQLRGSAHTVLRLERPDGCRVELELHAGSPALDIADLAATFWDRR